MGRLLVIAAAAVLLAACDGKSKDPTAVDITRGGTKAMERARDVSKVLEEGAGRAREAEDAAAKGGKE